MPEDSRQLPRQLASDDLITRQEHAEVIRAVVANERARSPVADSAYQHVIENAISGVEAIPDNREEALIYLLKEWLPFALDCQKPWKEAAPGA